MKVLIVTPGYPSDLDPVSGAFVREQARALKANHDIAVLCVSGQAMSLRSPGKWQRSTEEGIEVWRTYLHHKEARPYLLRFTLAVLAGFWKLRSGFQPDVIHARFTLPAGFVAALIGTLCRCPVVVTEDGRFSDYLYPRPRRLVLKWTTSRLSRLIVVSAWTESEVLASGISIPTEVVGNPVDCTVFYPALMQSDATCLKVVFVGRMAKGKGVDILLRAMKAVTPRLKRPLTLSLVGDGPDLGLLQQLSRDIGVTAICRFLGTRSREKVAQTLRESHFLVLPSLEETFGIVLVEAMACGLPVIATRCGGPESFVTPETGLIVPPGDVDALTAALETLASNLANYDPQRIAAHARENFGYEAVAARLTTVYESVRRDKQA